MKFKDRYMRLLTLCITVCVLGAFIVAPAVANMTESLPSNENPHLNDDIISNFGVNLIGKFIVLILNSSKLIADTLEKNGVINASASANMTDSSSENGLPAKLTDDEIKNTLAGLAILSYKETDWLDFPGGSVAMTGNILEKGLKDLFKKGGIGVSAFGGFVGGALAQYLRGKPWRTVMEKCKKLEAWKSKRPILERIEYLKTTELRNLKRLRDYENIYTIKTVNDYAYIRAGKIEYTRNAGRIVNVRVVEGSKIKFKVPTQNLITHLENPTFRVKPFLLNERTMNSLRIQNTEIYNRLVQHGDFVRDGTTSFNYSYYDHNWLREHNFTDVNGVPKGRLVKADDNVKRRLVEDKAEALLPQYGDKNVDVIRREIVAGDEEVNDLYEEINNAKNVEHIAFKEALFKTLETIGLCIIAEGVSYGVRALVDLVAQSIREKDGFYLGDYKNQVDEIRDEIGSPKITKAKIGSYLIKTRNLYNKINAEYKRYDTFTHFFNYAQGVLDLVFFIPFPTIGAGMGGMIVRAAADSFFKTVPLIVVGTMQEACIRAGQLVGNYLVYIDAMDKMGSDAMNKISCRMLVDKLEHFDYVNSDKEEMINFLTSLKKEKNELARFIDAREDFLNHNSNEISNDDNVDDDISYARSCLDIVQDEYDIINEKMNKAVDYARAEGLKFVSQSFVNSAIGLNNRIEEVSKNPSNDSSDNTDPLDKKVEFLKEDGLSIYQSLDTLRRSLSSKIPSENNDLDSKDINAAIADVDEAKINISRGIGYDLGVTNTIDKVGVANAVIDNNINTYDALSETNDGESLKETTDGLQNILDQKKSILDEVDAAITKLSDESTNSMSEYNMVPVKAELVEELKRVKSKFENSTDNLINSSWSEVLHK